MNITEGRLEFVEKVALFVGASLALIPLIGLTLNYTPFGIKPIPVFVSLLLLVVALGLIEEARRRKIKTKTSLYKMAEHEGVKAPLEEEVTPAARLENLMAKETATAKTINAISINFNEKKLQKH